MADFKENIGKNGEPLNLIGVVNFIKNGPNVGGSMVRFEIDQSGFKNVVDDKGNIDVKKAQNIEPEPRVTSTKGEFMTAEETAKLLAGGHFVKDDASGNFAGSVTSTMKHSHGKFGWIPDVDNISGEGYKQTARENDYGKILDRRDASRENAAAARAVAKGLSQMPDYSTEAVADAPKAPDTTPVASASAPAADAPQADLSEEVPF